MVMYSKLKKHMLLEMLTAFIKVNGATVGVVANRTKVYDDDMNVAAEYEAKLTVGGCKKAAEFVEFCDAFGIAILTLTNVDGLRQQCVRKNMVLKQLLNLYTHLLMQQFLK